MSGIWHILKKEPRKLYGRDVGAPSPTIFVDFGFFGASGRRPLQDRFAVRYLPWELKLTLCKKIFIIKFLRVQGGFFQKAPLVIIFPYTSYPRLSINSRARPPSKLRGRVDSSAHFAAAKPAASPLAAMFPITR